MLSFKRSSSSSSSSVKPGTRGAIVPVSGPTHGITEATAYGSGSTRVVSIPSGQPFSGRTYGGGTRSAVYGTQCVLLLSSLYGEEAEAIGREGYTEVDILV